MIRGHIKRLRLCGAVATCIALAWGSIHCALTRPSATSAKNTEAVAAVGTAQPRADASATSVDVGVELLHRAYSAARSGDSAAAAGLDWSSCTQATKICSCAYDCCYPLLCQSGLWRAPTSGRCTKTAECCEMLDVCVNGVCSSNDSGAGGSAGSGGSSEGGANKIPRGAMIEECRLLVGILHGRGLLR